MAARVHFEAATAVTPATTPAGLDTQVQFNDAGSFGASAGLTFNKTNGELVVNQLANSKGLSIYGNGANAGSYFKASVDNFGQPIISTNGTTRFANTSSFLLTSGGYARFTSSGFQVVSSYISFGTTSNLGARVNILGTGATSATTSLLVQNGSGSAKLRVYDDGLVRFYGSTSNWIDITGYSITSRFVLALTPPSGYSIELRPGNLKTIINSTQASATASLTIAGGDATQANLRIKSQPNVTTPNAGDMWFDTATNQLKFYNGSVVAILA